jgi:hypothetical protein
MQSDLIGTWRLVSASMRDVATGEQLALWGQRPNGSLVVTADSRWLVIQTAEGREPPRDDQKRAAAFRSMLAHSGKYRIEANTVIIAVDLAWDESWVGTEQVRHFKIEGSRLFIEAAPQRYDNLGDRVLRGLLVWERAE